MVSQLRSELHFKGATISSHFKSSLDLLDLLSARLR